MGDDSDCSITPQPGDQIGTGANPIDPRLGPLQENGGPTKTHALLFGSPAIDAVSDECGCITIGDSPEAVDQDQRGELRPMDGNMDREAYCDIGAYEKPPMSVGGTVEPVDLAELGTTDHQLSGDNNNHVWLVLWIGLAFVLAIGGGVFVLRRRRAH